MPDKPYLIGERGPERMTVPRGAVVISNSQLAPTPRRLMFDKIWLKDTAERAFWTAVETFLATMLLTVPSGVSVSALEAAGIAAIGAGLTVIKAAIASRRKGTISPASTAKADV